jgi:ribosome maturation factor RimP
VDYIAPEKIPYFYDCEPLVSGLGYILVELVVFRRQADWQIKIVITSKENVGIADCSKVHRAIMPRLEALLNTQDMYVEVASPGLDRVLKNATEFSVFTGKQVKVWNTDISDWMQGTIVSADTVSVRLRAETGETDIPYTKIAKAKLFNQA